jgi:nitrate reductase NapE component
LQPTPVISSSYINEFEFFLISLSPVIVVSLNFLGGRGFLLSLLG